MGNRIAKHIFSSDSIWEKSTYYARDAQGNVMSVYEHTIEDTLVNYDLTEQHIYGSSRLGMRTDTLEMVAATVDTAYYERILGKKQYEFSNHLGNVLTVVSDRKIPIDDNSDLTVDYFIADIVSATDYTPYGSPMQGRTFNSSAYRNGWNTQEKVDEIAGEGNHYTAEFWEYDPRAVHRWNLDPKPNPSFSPYAINQGNPIGYSDPKGDTVWVYATTLPGAKSGFFPDMATHTFIIVKTSDNKIHYYAYGPEDSSKPFGGSPLVQQQYSQDKEIAAGTNTEDRKAKILVEPPTVWNPTKENPLQVRTLTSDEFDLKVIETAESFGNNSKIEYDAMTTCETTGNCHTSTTTILSKSGLDSQELEDIEWQIPGLNWGFEDVKPWTATEQMAAVQRKEIRMEELQKQIDKIDVKR